MSFSSLGLPEPIVRSVLAVGYTEPTPIQRRAIPMILPGHDLDAASETGSGKTAAFLLPILSRLIDGPRALRALVLVPTRELAAQVEASGRAYARHSRLRVAAVYGGVPIPPQERLLRHEGVDVLIATPGRLLDLNGRQSVSLEDVEILVLDEADRMVDMGFAPDLRRILALLPKQRQTLMFSATMPAEVNKVAREALRNPQRLELAPPTRPPQTVDQAFYPVPRHLKVDLLHEILERASRGSVIVFARTKRGADRLARQLERRGHDIVVLHGDRSQSQRERALTSFRRGHSEILVATDIASRGIDVTHVTHVINYDVPLAPEDYVHRVGRTGRMNATGDALTLVSPEERKEAEAIERHMGNKVERLVLDDFNYHKAAEPRSREPRGHAARPAQGRRTGAHSHRAAAHGRVSKAESGKAGRNEKPSEGPTASHGRRARSKGPDRRNRRRM